MANDAGDWPWSSYLATVGRVPSPAWLQTGWILGQFHDERWRAELKYADFIRAGVGLPGIWSALRNQIFLGSKAFVSHLQSTISSERSLGEVPRLQRRSPAKPLDDYLSEYRDDPRLGMTKAYLTGDFTLKDVADAFGVHYTTVSRAVKAHEEIKALFMHRDSDRISLSGCC